eukprot:TRINITY_DN72270_c0_g1_i1.p1 TRINITY_DN72270_c0_g1~~TRINITY_DN72270_c0_g1_i1.p1  ORF type:complete len:332 (-),score=86.27 TRINITY_DN72270_c0_g1_i1:519-1379(-)
MAEVREALREHVGEQHAQQRELYKALANDLRTAMLEGLQPSLEEQRAWQREVQQERENRKALAADLRAAIADALAPAVAPVQKQREAQASAEPPRSRAAAAAATTPSESSESESAEPPRSRAAAAKAAPADSSESESESESESDSSGSSASSSSSSDESEPVATKRSAAVQDPGAQKTSSGPPMQSSPSSAGKPRPALQSASGDASASQQAPRGSGASTSSGVAARTRDSQADGSPEKRHVDVQENLKRLQKPLAELEVSFGDSCTAIEGWLDKRRSRPGGYRRPS